MAAARSLAQFQKAFSDEAKCVAFMFKRRWPDGFVCPACGKRRIAALKSRPRLYECLECVGMGRHEMGRPEPRRQRQPGSMHRRAGGDRSLSAAWLLAQKLRRSMFDPKREPLEGVVEIDQTEIPFREGDTVFESGNAGKILVIGAVEVIERDTNRSYS